MNAPEANPVWWVARVPGAECWVLTRLWFTAREIASAELGTDVNPVRA